jgi:hypothetical protein
MPSLSSYPVGSLTTGGAVLDASAHPVTLPCTQQYVIHHTPYLGPARAVVYCAASPALDAWFADYDNQKPACLYVMPYDRKSIGCGWSTHPSGEFPLQPAAWGYSYYEYEIHDDGGGGCPGGCPGS